MQEVAEATCLPKGSFDASNRADHGTPVGGESVLIRSTPIASSIPVSVPNPKRTAAHVDFWNLLNEESEEVTFQLPQDSLVTSNQVLDTSGGNTEAESALHPYWYGLRDNSSRCLSNNSINNATSATLSRSTATTPDVFEIFSEKGATFSVEKHSTQPFNQYCDVGYTTNEHAMSGDWFNAIGRSKSAFPVTGQRPYLFHASSSFSDAQSIRQERVPKTSALRSAVFSTAAHSSTIEQPQRSYLDEAPFNSLQDPTSANSLATFNISLPERNFVDEFGTNSMHLESSPTESRVLVRKFLESCGGFSSAPALTTDQHRQLARIQGAPGISSQNIEGIRVSTSRAHNISDHKTGGPVRYPSQFTGVASYAGKAYSNEVTPLPPQDETETLPIINEPYTAASSIEEQVAQSCIDILSGAAHHSLKAVELANTLRARVGTEILAKIRERWGGLLSLLEKHGAIFRVDRIPKNDKVTLIIPHNSDAKSSLRNHSLAVTQSSVGMPADFSPKNRTELEILYPRSGSAESEASNISQLSGNSPKYHHVNHLSLEHQEQHLPQKVPQHQVVELQQNHRTRSNGGFGTLHRTSGSATRCLHVGNVPSNLTEPQLSREFERFGHIDALKVISQKNGQRRFAFITFRTVEEATTARNCMSKVHPWKSAISFAHREHSSSSVHSLPTTATIGAKSSKSNRISQIVSKRQDGYGFQGHDLQSNILQEVSTAHHTQLSQRQITGTDSTVDEIKIDSNGSYCEIPQAFRHTNSTSGNSKSHIVMQQGANPHCQILKRLCDDCWVPTQPWPKDLTADSYFVDAIIQQLQQFGGSTTISKLRGFLRNRIAAVDNIKSVPLKALISAYSHLFSLDGNYVALLMNDGSGNYNSTEGTMPLNG